jgi:HSP20 family protein
MRRGQMSMSRWEPFTGLDIAGDLFGQMSRILTTAYPDVPRISVSAMSPPVRIQEADDGYIVEAHLPGIPPDDVSVELEGKELRIVGGFAEPGQDGEATQDGEAAADGTPQPRVIRAGRFEYRVTLPAEVDSGASSAELDNGVLRLRLPKAASATRQRIPVQTAGSSLPSGEGQPATTGAAGAS